MLLGLGLLGLRLRLRLGVGLGLELGLGLWSVRMPRPAEGRLATIVGHRGQPLRTWSIMWSALGVPGSYIKESITLTRSLRLYPQIRHHATRHQRERLPPGAARLSPVRTGRSTGVQTNVISRVMQRGAGAA